MTTYMAPPDQTGLVLNDEDTLHVEVNGIAYGTLINNGGNEYVGGGISIGTTINFGGQEFVDDGTSFGTIINVGGIQYDQGGASIGTMINESGQEFVQNGPLAPSTATNTTINGAGAFQLVDGGTSIATTIKAGGTELVYNGGTANGTIIQDGGTEHVQNSGTANAVIFAGSNSLLELDTPSGLTGTIIDWHVGDKIDFLNTIVTGVNETGNTLTVTYGHHQTASYSLAGKQANTEFKLQPDGNGGTDLLLQLPGAPNSASAHLLSLAGGGIKAMTADAGLFAGLLDYFSSKEPTIGKLLSNESAVSANSGSSWFMDLLAYSKSFDNSLQDYNDFFSKTGYMGQLKTAYYDFAKEPDINPLLDKILKAIGDIAGIDVDQIYKLLINSSVNWNTFLSKVIFEPDDAAQTLQCVDFYSNQSLHTDSNQSLRTDALSSQSLIYESAISSNAAAINKYLPFGINETVSTITNAGTDASGKPYVFIPAAITSLGSAQDMPAPALPSISTDTLDVTYSTYSTLLPSHSATTTLPNFNFDGLSAFLAASASSAAVSAVASGANNLASESLYGVQNVSPLVQVKNAKGTSTASDPPSNILDGTTTPDSLTHGTSLLRLADGGYIDNTSVTSGLTYLQANNELSNFADTVLTYSGGPSDPNLPPDYSKIGEQADVLFTGSNQNQTKSGLGLTLNLSHPSAAVFDATKTTGLANPIWEYKSPDGFELDYFQLGVTTALNNNFGIKGGVNGTLNLWVVTTTAQALPSLNQESWSQYEHLYDQMISALQHSDNGHYGADLLASSLGFTTVAAVQPTGIAPELNHAMV
jgi:autotransporter passenger strand-loop-strand repeat protein